MLAHSLAGVASGIALLTARPEVTCKCGCEHDRKLLEILEAQLARCGPERLTGVHCPGCLCECGGQGSLRLGLAVVFLLGLLTGASLALAVRRRPTQEAAQEPEAVLAGVRAELPAVEDEHGQDGQRSRARAGPLTPARRHGTTAHA